MSRILIIDSDGSAGSTVRALLESEFHDVVIVEDAESAVRELSSSEPTRNHEIANPERANVRELGKALSILRQYVEEVGSESESNPSRMASLRGIITGALRAIEQVCHVVAVDDGVRGGVDLIGLGGTAIRMPAIRQCHRPATCPDRGQLTPREREVVALVSEGVSNKTGAFRLSISVRTFEAHRANAMCKLGARNTAELVRFGLEAAR